jgi:hypothetical protein
MILVAVNNVKVMYSKLLNQANKFGLKNEFNNFVKSTIKNKLIGDCVDENANNLNEHIGFGKSSSKSSSRTQSLKSSARSKSSKSSSGTPSSNKRPVIVRKRLSPKSRRRIIQSRLASRRTVTATT